MSIQPIAHKIVKKIIQFYSKRRQVKPPDLLKEKKTLRLAYIISGGVGDAIMAFPALQKLKYLLPDSLLSVYVPSRKLELIQALFSEYKVLPFRTGYRGLSDLLFCRNVSDIVFTNTTSVFRVSVEIAAYFRGRTSCGFRYAEENEKSRLYTVSQPYSDTMHEVEQNLSLVVRTLNAAYDADDIFYPSFPESAPLPARGNGIVIHAGSKQGYEKKRWPVENYCALVKMLALKGYTSAVLIGPEDLALAERFKKEGVLTMPSSSADHLITVLKNARLFIGNDSGPAHVAAFLGTPTLVLFGPTDPARCRPLSRQGSVLYGRVGCSPCHFSGVRCDNYRCVKAITVERVLQHIEQRMNSV